MRRRHDRFAPVLAALLLGALAAVGPVTTATAAAPTGATRVIGATSAATTDVLGPFGIDLADPNDFVAQANFVQCVGASMQMMLNIMGASDRTARTQARLQTLARDLSGPTRAGFKRKGASVAGWMAALNQLDPRPYRFVGADTLQEALQLAARSIRDHLSIIEALEARDTERAEDLVRNHALGLAEHVAKYADYLD